jgi:hypothetical protein
MTSARKQSAVLRLLHGEPLDMLSRELQVTAADLGEWRDKSLAAGEASLKAQPRDGREAEISRLKSKLGGLTMDNELLIRTYFPNGDSVPFCSTEVEGMSATFSISVRQAYGIARVCRVWGVRRETPDAYDMMRS